MDPTTVHAAENLKRQTERAVSFLDDMPSGLSAEEARGAGVAVVLTFLTEVGCGDVVDAFVRARRRFEF